MHGDHVAAAWALVFFCLFLQELVHAFGSECLLVFNHAHAVAFPVALVKVGEVLAGHLVAFIAELDFVASKLPAASLDVAVFGPWQAARAVSDPAPLTRHPMGKSQVTPADTAVHTARSNKLRISRLLSHRHLSVRAWELTVLLSLVFNAVQEISKNIANFFYNF